MPFKRVLIIRRFKTPEVMDFDKACSKFNITASQLDNLIDTGNSISFENKEYCFDYPIIEKN